MDNTTTIACTLSETQLDERINFISQEILSGASTTVELEDDYELTVPGDEVCLRKLTDFIALERNCCSTVFRFEMTFLPNHGPILLRIRGNGGIKQQLQAVFSL